jgi:hypothetical protein
MSYPEFASEDEEHYAALADEFNDFAHDDQNRPTTDMFDDDVVEGAKRYAKFMKLRFPPGIGDYDRYWERKYNN